MHPSHLFVEFGIKHLIPDEVRMEQKDTRKVILIITALIYCCCLCLGFLGLAIAFADPILQSLNL
jgi:hypothetical protein